MKAFDCFLGLKAGLESLLSKVKLEFETWGEVCVVGAAPAPPNFVGRLFLSFAKVLFLLHCS